MRLKDCALRTAHLHTILPTLARCPALANIDLSDNHVTADGIEALVASRVLQPDSPLRDLRLANNWCGPASVYALARPLAANVGLQHLDVTNTGVRPVGESRFDSDQRALQVMARALQVGVNFSYPCSRLTRIYLHVVYHRVLRGRQTLSCVISMCRGRTLR